MMEYKKEVFEYIKSNPGKDWLQIWKALGKSEEKEWLPLRNALLSLEDGGEISSGLEHLGNCEKGGNHFCGFVRRYY